MTDRPTRRELMRPVQLLVIAFVCAVFAGGVTLVSGGFFAAGVGVQALPLAGIVAAVTFIGVLVGLSLLLLAVDPRQVTQTVDRPVLFDPEDEAEEASAASDDEGRADDGERPGG